MILTPQIILIIIFFGQLLLLIIVLLYTILLNLKEKSDGFLILSILLGFIIALLLPLNIGLIQEIFR